VYVGHYELELESIPAIEFRTPEPETFGEYIRKLRILKGWSQRELARKIGSYPTTIIGWEKDRNIPARKWIIKLIKTLSADAWETIQFDGVLSERQWGIIRAFPDKVFTHKDCMGLLGSRYLYDDLEYLVALEVLEKRLKGRTGYYQIAGMISRFRTGTLVRS
jgi:transcriptional regulator with XRE-family HTH domain